MIDFQGAQISSDTGFILLREIDERFSIIDPMRDGDCLGAKRRPGNVHSADGALDFITPLVKRYRPWFKLFWLRGDAAFANPEIYEVVCAYGLSLSPGAPLPSGACLGFLSFTALKEKIIFNRDFCYSAFHQAIDSQERKFTCIIFWKRGLQNHFLIEVAMAAA
jgi:hypothetical protein